MGILSNLDSNPYPTCISYLEGKMTKRLFTGYFKRATYILELIYSDVYEPNIQARGSYNYFVTFIDDYSRYDYLYLIKRKSETFETFKEFKAEVENEKNKTILTLRSD